MAARRAGHVDAIAPETTHNLVGQRLGRKGQETRDRIIAAMTRLLDQPADVPITLSAVAREAATGMSTLYLYFPDLGELVLAVLRRTIRENEPVSIAYLGTVWSDATLAGDVLDFTRAHVTFFETHARLMQLRNAFADARDERFVRYRQKMSGPVRAMLVRQMGARLGACADIYEDCAAVMLTGLERVATIIINPDFAALASVDGPGERDRYVERLTRAEARVIEATIRSLRAETGFDGRQMPA